MELVLASGNAGKLVELRELLDGSVGLRAQSEFGVTDADETGLTFIENALLKARHAARITGLPSLADDSGLCVDALNGDPGVYTADWAGVPRDFGHAMKRVEDALQAANATSPGQRKASFNATLCLAHPDGRDVIYHGQCFGTLVWPPRGDQGHGYDPVFMPDGYDITFGQMSPQLKHSWSPGQQGLSHRARSFAKFVENQIER